MFKKRKTKSRGSHGATGKSVGRSEVVSRGTALLDVELVGLSSASRARLQVPAAAFTCLAVHAVDPVEEPSSRLRAR